MNRLHVFGGERSLEKDGIVTEVLLVEDDEACRSVLDHLLRQAGFAVLTAPNGKQALDILRSRQPQIIVVDIIMPEMDGLEFLLALRNQQHEAPVIAVSGGGRMRAENMLSVAKRLGAVSVLSKPFSRADLVEAIGKALEARGIPAPAPLAHARN